MHNGHGAGWGGVVKVLCRGVGLPSSSKSGKNGRSVFLLLLGRDLEGPVFWPSFSISLKGISLRFFRIPSLSFPSERLICSLQSVIFSTLPPPRLLFSYVDHGPLASVCLFFFYRLTSFLGRGDFIERMGVWEMKGFGCDVNLNAIGRLPF